MLSSHADSRRLFGSDFRNIGPATAKAQQLNVLRRWRGTTSWRRLTERRYADEWRRQRRTYSSPPGTGELCAVADTDELSDRAWTQLVRERRASASRCEDVPSHSRTSECRWRDVLQRSARAEVSLSMVTGNPIGMGITDENRYGNGQECESTSMGIGTTYPW